MAIVIPPLPGQLMVPPGGGTTKRLGWMTDQWYAWFNAMQTVLGSLAGGSGGPVPASRMINTIAPLTGGGNLASDLTLALQANGVTNAFLAQMGAGTLKGNNTGGSATPQDLTATQVTAMLNVFTAVLQGMVPASGGGTTNFLRADGTWQPAGGGGVTIPGNVNDLVWWFETDNMQMNNGSLITVLSDRVPWHAGWISGFEYRAPGTTNQAAVVSAGLNGLNTMVFPATGASVGYQYTGDQKIPGVLAQSTCFFVVNTHLAAAGTGCVALGASNAAGLEIDIFNTGGANQLNVTSALTAIIATSSAVGTAGTWVQMNAQYDDLTGNYAFRIGRAAAGSGTATIRTISQPTVALGYNAANAAAGGNTFGFAAVLIYNRLLTAGEITTVETYLFNKWGV